MTTARDLVSICSASTLPEAQYPALYLCIVCRNAGRSVAASTALHLHRHNRERAGDVLSRLANKGR